MFTQDDIAAFDAAFTWETVTQPEIKREALLAALEDIRALVTVETNNVEAR